MSLDNQEHYINQDESETRSFMTPAFFLNGHTEAGWIHPPVIRRPFSSNSLFLN